MTTRTATRVDGLQVDICETGSLIIDRRKAGAAGWQREARRVNTIPPAKAGRGVFSVGRDGAVRPLG